MQITKPRHNSLIRPLTNVHSAPPPPRAFGIAPPGTSHPAPRGCIARWLLPSRPSSPFTGSGRCPWLPSFPTELSRVYRVEALEGHTTAHLRWDASHESQEFLHVQPPSHAAGRHILEAVSLESSCCCSCCSCCWQGWPLICLGKSHRRLLTTQALGSGQQGQVRVFVKGLGLAQSTTSWEGTQAAPSEVHSWLRLRWLKAPKNAKDFAASITSRKVWDSWQWNLGVETS